MVGFASNEDVAEIANANVCGMFPISPEDVELAGGEFPTMLENVDEWTARAKADSDAVEKAGENYDRGGREGALRRAAFAVLKNRQSSDDAKILAWD